MLVFQPVGVYGARELQVYTKLSWVSHKEKDNDSDAGGEGTGAALLGP